MYPVVFYRVLNGVAKLRNYDTHTHTHTTNQLHEIEMETENRHTGRVHCQMKTHQINNKFDLWESLLPACHLGNVYKLYCVTYVNLSLIYTDQKSQRYYGQ